jgi:peptidoglycan/xylan/chitin deacetylase (PgdA/CDA1 family)
MYHRVADIAYDPWGLAIAPDRFRDQLEALLETRRFISMEQLVEGLERGDLPPAATAVTFDDGYADNAVIAKPILEELGVPATMFLTSGFIGSPRGFWWDELAALVFIPCDGAEFDFTVAGVRLRAAWAAQKELPAELAAWRTAHPTADPRRVAYLELWRALQGLAAADRDAAMARLRQLLGDGSADGIAGADRPMSRNEAAALASTLVSVGGHGRTHVPLTALSPAGRDEEIARGRSEVAAFNGGRPPDGFAYPHGSWDAGTRRAVEQAGYRWAVGSHAAKIDRKVVDRFVLPRVEAGAGTGAELVRVLRSIGF